MTYAVILGSHRPHRAYTLPLAFTSAGGDIKAAIEPFMVQFKSFLVGFEQHCQIVHHSRGQRLAGRDTQDSAVALFSAVVLFPGY